jgi:hypothetical protein
MKFCINCRYYETGSDVPRCQSPHAQMIDPVSGVKNQQLCVSMRWGLSPCGPDATLFEPKEGAPA